MGNLGKAYFSTELSLAKKIENFGLKPPRKAALTTSLQRYSPLLFNTLPRRIFKVRDT